MNETQSVRNASWRNQGFSAALRSPRNDLSASALPKRQSRSHSAPRTLLTSQRLAAHPPSKSGPRSRSVGEHSLGFGAVRLD